MDLRITNSMQELKLKIQGRGVGEMVQSINIFLHLQRTQHSLLASANASPLACMGACTHTCTSTHTHMHTYTYTYTYTQTNRQTKADTKRGREIDMYLGRKTNT